MSDAAPRRATLTGMLLIVVLAVWWLLHPVCRPLSDADVREFARWAPIETREDRQLHGRVFQLRGGRWYQCKSWVSRQLLLLKRQLEAAALILFSVRLPVEHVSQRRQLLTFHPATRLIGDVPIGTDEGHARASRGPHLDEVTVGLRELLRLGCVCLIDHEQEAAHESPCHHATNRRSTVCRVPRRSGCRNRRCRAPRAAATNAC